MGGRVGVEQAAATYFHRRSVICQQYVGGYADVALNNDVITCQAIDWRFDGPCAVDVDVDGNIVVVDYNDHMTSIYIIEPDYDGTRSNEGAVGKTKSMHLPDYADGSKGNATIRKLDLRDSSGNRKLLAAPYGGWTNIAIGNHGELYCTNTFGIHCIKNTGLSAGLRPWRRAPYWSPARSTWTKMKNVTPPHHPTHTRAHTRGRCRCRPMVQCA